MHPYHRNERIIEWCKEKNIHVTAYSPLGSPDSASMFRRTTPVLLQDQSVIDVAATTGKNSGQVRSRQ